MYLFIHCIHVKRIKIELFVNSSVMYLFYYLVLNNTFERDSFNTARGLLKVRDDKYFTAI